MHRGQVLPNLGGDQSSCFGSRDRSLCHNIENIPKATKALSDSFCCSAGREHVAKEKKGREKSRKMEENTNESRNCVWNSTGIRRNSGKNLQLISSSPIFSVPTESQSTHPNSDVQLQPHKSR